MFVWRLPPQARILFFKATFKDQSGYTLRGPHGKRRWRKMNMIGQMPGLFNELPVAITSINGLLCRSAKDVYLRTKPDLVGKIIQRTRSGLVIKIGGNAFRHSIFHRFSPESGLAHQYLVELLERAVLAEIQPPRKSGDEGNLKAVYRLYAPAQINSALYRVKLTVKAYTDSNERNIHYDLDLVEIENSVRVTGDDSARTATTTLPPVRAESALSIADLLRGATRDSDHQPFTP